MEYKLTMEQKLTELHQFVSFVSRKRIHIENNMLFLDTYGMFRHSQEKCGQVWLDEDFFINTIEEDSIDESFVDNHLEMFFIHNGSLNKIIQVMQIVNEEEKFKAGHFRFNDLMEDLLNGDYEGTEDELKELWERLKLN